MAAPKRCRSRLPEATHRALKKAVRFHQHDFGRKGTGIAKRLAEEFGVARHTVLRVYRTMFGLPMIPTRHRHPDPGRSVRCQCGALLRTGTRNGHGFEYCSSCGYEAPFSA